MIEHTIQQILWESFWGMREYILSMSKEEVSEIYSIQSVF